MVTDLGRGVFREDWLTVSCSVFGMFLGSNAGTKNLIANACSVDTRTVQNWNTVEKRHKSVCKHVYDSNSPTREQEIGFAEKTISQCWITDETESRNHFGIIARICRDIEVSGCSDDFEHLINILDISSMDCDSRFFKGMYSLDAVKMYLVLLAIVNTKIEDHDSLILILKEVCTENEPEKGESIYSNQWNVRQKESFLEYLGEYLPKKFQISKIEFYRKATGCDDPDSASDKWYRWKNKELKHKGSGELAGISYPLEEIIFNLKENKLIEDRDCCQLLLIAYKTLILSNLIKIEFDGISIPEGLSEIRFKEGDSLTPKKDR